MIDLTDRLNKNDYATFFKFIKLNDNFNELWKLKNAARRVLKEWLISMSFTRDTSELISNASCELMENIIKFSKEDETAFIVVSVSNKSLIYIETYNKSDTISRDNLNSFLKGINSAGQTIEALYLDRLKKAINSDESKLGIIKVLLETGGKVELVEEEDEETVHIRFQVKIA